MFLCLPASHLDLLLNLLYVYRFLGFVDKIGTAFQAKEVATGFGVHLAIPMIREAREKGNLTRETARKVSGLYLLEDLSHFLMKRFWRINSFAVFTSNIKFITITAIPFHL